MSQTMTSSAIGDFVFYVEDPETGDWDYFVCSSVRLTLGLNMLPSATVVVGCGKSIRNDDRSWTYTSELLYKRVIENQEAGASMVNCQIYEVHNIWTPYERRTQIFDGVITGASLVYKAGTATNRAVRFECLHAACYLHAVPLGMTRYLIGSFVIAALEKKAPKDVPQYGWMQSRKVEIDSLCTALSSVIRGEADIATRVSYLVDGIIAMSGDYDGVRIPEAEDLDIMHIRDYIESDYTINHSLYLKHIPAGAAEADLKALSNTNDNRDTTIDDTYNRVLGRLLLERLQGTSVLEAIVSILTSDQYMLNIVPRMSGRLRIEPSNAWASTPSRTLTFKDLKAFNSTVNPLAHVADPDVFIVNFSEALPMYGSLDMTGQPTALSGVYSRNEVFNEERRKLLQGQEHNLESVTVMAHFKQRIINAPIWLTDSFIGSSVSTDTPNVDQIQPTPGQITADINQKDKADDGSDKQQYNVDNTRLLADDIAKALFGFMHGRTNTAEVELLPSLRFGADGNTPLENLIGKIIDITPEDVEEGLEQPQDALLAVRGMVTSISFSYDTGTASSCSYTMQLSRVRPLIENEESLDCPLYASLKKTE